jgi:hypothetical protein
MDRAEKISPPQGRIEITELFPEARNLIETNLPGSQRIEFDGMDIAGMNPMRPTSVSILDKERKVIMRSYHILRDGTVIECEYDPNKPGEIIERKHLKNVLAAGIITTYGPPEKKQMKDGTTETIGPVVKRELVLVPKGKNF